MWSARFFALCWFLACAAIAHAARLEIPLRLPVEAVRDALAQQIAASSRGTGTIYREGRCRYLQLGNPALTAADGALQLTAPGTAALGLELAGTCQNAVAWRGSMQFTLMPLIDAQGRLRLRILDSRLSDAGGSPAAGFIWEMSKRYVHAELERFSYDLASPRAALVGVVRGVAPARYSEELARVLAQLAIGQPRVGAGAVVLPVSLDIPDTWVAPAPSVPSAPLSPAELEALDEGLQPWDAFLVYCIKQLALDNANAGLRARLFTLLLDSRYRLSAVLSGEEPAGDDALRALFVDSWNELRAILDQAQRAGLLNGSPLRYAAFVDAGDALVTLDHAAPGLRMHPSADALRQLARALTPGAAGDPLAYDDAVDPQLRSLFDVPEIVAPPRTSWLDSLIRSAHAADDADGQRALDRWVPTHAELDAYQTRLGALLEQASRRALGAAALGAPYDAVYADLVPTTALIESCWRQYVIRAGKVAYLRSASNSVGVMQVNQRVWRGFYDVQQLRWSTAYNVRAGAQILLRYLKDYAIPYAERSGKPGDAPRAVYAVYNAGPRAVGRFHKPQPHPREKRVDDRFWTLYQGIAAGGRPDLQSCAVEVP
jgi:hypothetical protein